MVYTINIGYCILNNASNNDTAVDHLFKRISSELSEAQRKQRRLRYLAHTVNILVTTMLYKSFGKMTTAFHDGEAWVYDWETETPKSAEKYWREREALGRMHNIATYITATPQRREAFKNTQVNDDSGVVDSLVVSISWS